MFFSFFVEVFAFGSLRNFVGALCFFCWLMKGFVLKGFEESVFKGFMVGVFLVV